MATAQYAPLVEQALDAQQKIVRALHRQSEPRWSHLDLTMSQLKALMLLARSQPLSVSGIAAELGLGRPAASLLVDGLVRQGLVSRSEDAADRRRAVVELSPRGGELVLALREGSRARLAEWLERLEPADLAALARGLTALAVVAAGA